MKITRRDALLGLGLLPWVAQSGACTPSEPRNTATTRERSQRSGALPAAQGESPTAVPAAGAMPVIFAAHGAPFLLDDAGWMGELRAWAQAMPRPRAVLMVSAHWEQRPVTLGATTTVPLVYDFYGFPPQYYQTKYPAPGAPELAAQVHGLLRGKAIASGDDPRRGLDHGAYVPLVAMYPEADVPVLQLSMSALDPRTLFELGQALAPLRAGGVLVFGSGFLTHNMRYTSQAGTPQWAREFDDWVAGALARFDVDALLDFQQRAPAAQLALPTWEHYAPVLVAAGAAASEGQPRATFPITGWWMNGAFTRRSVQFG